jgi:hypothetical protein
LYKWKIQSKSNASSSFYLVRHKGRATTYFHRELLECPNSLHVDHINGNSLDNRMSNLRSCTHQQNRCNSKLSSNNSTGFKGVDYMKSKEKFRARIKYQYKEIHLGLFEYAEDAALAYNDAAITYFGEFARLNII